MKSLAVGVSIVPLVMVIVGASAPVGSRRTRATQARTIVSGQVLDGSGQGLRAWVWLNAPLPRTGKTTKSLSLARGRTDATGRFALWTANQPALRALAMSNGGWINLDLLAGSGHFYLYRSIARRYTPLTERWTGVGGKNKAFHLVISRHAQGVARSKIALVPLHLPARATAPPPCHEITTVVDERDQNTEVGELHTARNQTATFTYGVAADSTIAVKFTGPDTAGWSLGGETHIANFIESGASETWPAGENFHRLLLTKFHYVKRRTYNNCTGSRYTVEASKWDGGEDVGGIADDPTKDCHHTRFKIHQLAGGMFRRTSSRAVQYGHAVRVLGVELSATSGYSKNVEATWKFTGAGWLCGDTDFPVRSQRIFAGH